MDFDVFTLGGKISLSSVLSALLCSLCGRPLTEPRQVSCGDRICSKCYNGLLASSTRKFKCKKCNSEVTTDECFRDRAVESDLKRASFPCYHAGCPWSGSNLNYADHADGCRYATVRCPNNGCDFRAPMGEQAAHAANCLFQPVPCRWCDETYPRAQQQDHLSLSCAGAMVKCSAGCGAQVLRKELSAHLEKKCPKQKRTCGYGYLGCTYAGDSVELTAHEEDSTPYHLKLLSDDVRVNGPRTERVDKDSALSAFDIRGRKGAIDTQLATMYQELARVSEETNQQFTPLRESLHKLECTVSDFQESFSELALMVQTLQATSYNGEFIWKIPELARRMKEARVGKTVSLYSAPFYTSRFGYKMCLRLYLNGDGSGKGTHLSFFLTIMRGEYDALLSWPFQQMVTLTLLDQDKRKNIVQCFRPEPSSSSFWQPKTEMNVASGCPKFAPLSILDSQSYTRNDTIYLKVIIDKTGLEQP